MNKIIGYAGFLLLGLLFGWTLIEAQVISWYRIQEMFRFQSFHMFGVIGTAVAAGALSLFLIRRYGARNASGERIGVMPKERTVVRYLAGGAIFGLGWALTGACPAPMFILFASGFSSVGIVLGGALLGTLLYGLLRERLPH